MNYLTNINNIMKNIIVFLFVTCGFSCVQRYDTYVIKNQTKHKIEINAFWTAGKTANNKPVFIEAILINPLEYYEVKKGIGERIEDGGVFENRTTDSINMIFDSKRIVKYSCLSGNLCTDQRNILNYDEYYDRDCKRVECTYTYTINEEDYENAIPIE